MAVATMTRCDCDCGASSDAPGEQGWWLVEAASGLGADMCGETFMIRGWNTTMEPDSPEFYMHAAGSECVHKLLNAWMEKQRETK